MPNLTSPPWVREAGGAPASLQTNKATPEELAAFLAQCDEAVAMQESMGRGQMSDEQRLLAGYVQLETVARANLELADQLSDVQVQAYREMLAVALYKQGRLDEALTLELNDDWYERLSALRDAIDRPDTELRSHLCERRTEDGLIFDRRVAVEEIYSLRHRQIVAVYCCTECGELNATSERPERQRGAEERRVQARVMIAAAPAGSTVNLAQFADTQLLKAETA